VGSSLAHDFGELDTGRTAGDVGLHFLARQAWLEQARAFRLIVLYERRIGRTVERNMLELSAMQAERKQAYAEAHREAILLAGLAKSEGRTYDPAPDFQPAANYGGFVFSAPAIARQIDREQRLSSALAARDLA
jgi:hypothetical protein